MQMSPPVLEVDVVALAIHHERLHVLLVRRVEPPCAGQWALPGARLDPDERLADAARRTLAERAHLHVDLAYLEQLFTFDAPDRDPRGRTLSVAYFALLPLGASLDVQPGRGVDAASWHPLDSVPPLAFDHADILQNARARVAAKVDYAPIAFTVLPSEFTMRDLRTVHELLTGRPYAHETNFWRQMANRWHLEETGRRVYGRGRPSALYRFPGAPPPAPTPAPFHPSPRALPRPSAPPPDGSLTRSTTIPISSRKVRP